MELSVRSWSAATSFIAQWHFYSWGQHQFTVFSFSLVFVCRYDLGGCWTVRDCMVVYRNTSHVRCQCQRLGTFGVLMDSSHREVSGLPQSWLIYPKSRTNAIFLCEQQLEGDLETLGLVTYCTLCLSMLALILTVLVLSCLRGLKSNTRSIHSNTAAAMFLSKLVFLLGINQTEQQVACVFIRFSLWLLPITKLSREAFLFISASFSPSCWKS